MFISCCTVWAFRGGGSSARFRDCLCLRTDVCSAKRTCVCFCMWLYALAWRQIAAGECAISRTSSLLVQRGGRVWEECESGMQQENLPPGFLFFLPNSLLLSSCPNWNNSNILEWCLIGPCLFDIEHLFLRSIQIKEYAQDTYKSSVLNLKPHKKKKQKTFPPGDCYLEQNFKNLTQLI